jgi:TetR/AcrR family transcriptional regulator, tetracycline repressor protein
VTSTRGVGHRAGIDRADVIAAARAQLIEHGAAGLSMRAVAVRLGVAPNSLYSHVDGKAGLIDAVLDDLIGEIPLPPPDLAPRAAIEQIMLDSFDALVRHPDLVALSLARQGSGGRNAWRLGDAVLERLDALGVAKTDAREGLRVMLVHLMGCTAFATQYDRSLGERPPHRVEDVRRDFARGMAWLLDGVLGLGSPATSRPPSGS